MRLVLIVLILSAHYAHAQKPSRAREAMRAACEADKWSANVRACLVVGWTVGLQRECLAGIDGTPAPERRWSTPPLELVTSSGPACAKYFAAVKNLYTCDPANAIEAAVAIASDDAARSERDATVCSARLRAVEALSCHRRAP